MDGLAIEHLVLEDKMQAVPVATLGSNLTPVQVQQLRKYEKIVYLPDWDTAGVKGALYNGRVLTEAGLNVRVAIPERMDERDPGNFTLDELRRQYNGSLLYNRTCEKRLRISATRR
jgi:hypothetical protein